MASSKIEWTNATWNPTTGCSKVSPGCKYCYAERMSKRLKAMKTRKYSNGFRLTLHEDTLAIPLLWKKPRRIFVDSMSDLFHEDVPIEFVVEVFKIMRLAYWHQFQILTKRSNNLLAYSKYIDWPDNVWMGVSVENEDYISRVDDLLQTKAKVKFLSLEPLLGPLFRLDLLGIDWVIVGGESGPGARGMKEEWVIDIRDKCIQNCIPFFFKQWGGINRIKAGREISGRTWDEFPDKKLQNIDI